MNVTVNESRTAIRSAQVGYVRDTAEFVYLVGMHLKNLEEKGINLAQEIRDEYSFSPERGYAFKRFYELSVNKPSVDVKTLGVDKVLALIEPLRADTDHFFKEHSVEEIKEMTIREVRGLNKEYVKKKGNKFVSGRGEKSVQFFLDAEDSLRSVLATFQGIHTRYHEEYTNWDRKEKNLMLAKELNKTIEGCLELSDKLVKVLGELQ